MKMKTSFFFFPFFLYLHHHHRRNDRSQQVLFFLELEFKTFIYFKLKKNQQLIFVSPGCCRCDANVSSVAACHRWLQVCPPQAMKQKVKGYVLKGESGVWRTKGLELTACQKVTNSTQLTSAQKRLNKVRGSGGQGERGGGREERGGGSEEGGEKMYLGTVHSRWRKTVPNTWFLPQTRARSDSNGPHVWVELIKRTLNLSGPVQRLDPHFDPHCFRPRRL